jgi:hypothetical protein
MTYLRDCEDLRSTHSNNIRLNTISPFASAYREHVAHAALEAVHAQVDVHAPLHLPVTKARTGVNA